MARKNKKSKKIINIIIFLIILILIVVCIKNNKKENKSETTDDNSQVENQTEQNETEKYVKVLENGTKINTSLKLQESKKIEDLEIKDIQLTYKNGVTNLLATVENIKKEKIEMIPVEIELIDENGNSIYKLRGIIEETEEGNQAEINCSITADFANAYDFRIGKSEM